MRPERAQAAPGPAKCFVAVFTPGGTVPENWRPTGDEQSFTLGPIVAWLTGTGQDSATGFATGPSIDQVLKSRLSLAPIKSLALAVRWGTGKGRGQPSPVNIASFADTPTFDPIAPRIDPVAIWQELFGTPPSSELTWQRAMLDGVMSR